MLVSLQRSNSFFHFFTTKIFSYISVLLYGLMLSMHSHAKTDTTRIKVNGVNLYYELHGKGEPIVLIAGFTCDHNFWAGIINQLSSNHQVLVFDNRGIGQSDTPKGPYTIEMMADDTIGLIDKLGFKDSIIVGQSMGSAIAQNIAKRFPNRVKKLILINTFYELGKIQKIAFEAAGDLQKINVPLKYRFSTLIPWVFSSEFLSQPNQLENLIKLAEQNPYPQSLIGYEGQLDSLRKFNSLSWLNTISSPTLIIAGTEDIIAPLDGAKEISNKIKKSHLEIIPGGHASPVEQPTKVAQIILDFIQN